MANTWTNFYPTLWSDRAFIEFSQATVAGRVTNLTWASPEAGEAIRIPKFAYSESGIADVSSLVDTPSNVSEATLVLNFDRHKGFHFEIPYIEQDKANVALLESTAMQRARALANVVDKDVLSGMTGATTTLSGTIVKATLVSAIELLNKANAPQTDRCLVVNPDGYSDLLNTSDFVRADSIQGADGNRSGHVGMVLGLEVFLTNNLPTSGCDAVVLHRAAIAMAFRKSIDVRVFDVPRRFATGCTGRAAWGRAVIDADLMVAIDRP